MAYKRKYLFFMFQTSFILLIVIIKNDAIDVPEIYIRRKCYSCPLSIQMYLSVKT